LSRIRSTTSAKLEESVDFATFAIAVLLPGKQHPSFAWSMPQVNVTCPTRHSGMSSAAVKILLRFSIILIHKENAMADYE